MTTAATLAATSGGGLPITWILLAVLAIFWIFLLMQNRKRRAAQLEQRSAISPGSKVLLTSGFIGTLLSKDGDQAEVELAPGLTVRVLATAIARTLPDEVEATDSSTPGALDEGSLSTSTSAGDTSATDAARLTPDGVSDAAPSEPTKPPSSTDGQSAVTDNGNNRRD